MPVTAALEAVALRDCRTGECETVPAAALFFMIGAQPHTAWLPDAICRDERGYLLTGSDLPEDDWPLERPQLMLETSLPGVFAVGDARHGSTKRVASAVGEGSVVIEQVHQLMAPAESPGRCTARAVGPRAAAHRLPAPQTATRSARRACGAPAPPPSRPPHRSADALGRAVAGVAGHEQARAPRSRARAGRGPSGQPGGRRPASSRSGPVRTKPAASVATPLSAAQPVRGCAAEAQEQRAGASAARRMPSARPHRHGREQVAVGPRPPRPRFAGARRCAGCR